MSTKTAVLMSLSFSTLSWVFNGTALWNATSRQNTLVWFMKYCLSPYFGNVSSIILYANSRLSGVSKQSSSSVVSLDLPAPRPPLTVFSHTSPPLGAYASRGLGCLASPRQDTRGFQPSAFCMRTCAYMWRDRNFC